MIYDIETIIPSIRYIENQSQENFSTSLKIGTKNIFVAMVIKAIIANFDDVFIFSPNHSNNIFQLLEWY